MIIKTNKKKSIIDIPESVPFRKGLLGFQQTLPSLYMPENQPALLFFSQTSFLPTPYSISLSHLFVFSSSLLKTSSFLLKMSHFSSFSSLTPYYLWMQSPQRCQESPHTFNHSPTISPPKISITFSLLSLKCLLNQEPPLSIYNTSFFFSFSLGISHHQPWNSSLFNSSF